jgi:hypothetical protein
MRSPVGECCGRAIESVNDDNSAFVQTRFSVSLEYKGLRAIDFACSNSRLAQRSNYSLFDHEKSSKNVRIARCIARSLSKLKRIVDRIEILPSCSVKAAIKGWNKLSVQLFFDF